MNIVILLSAVWPIKIFLAKLRHAPTIRYIFNYVIIQLIIKVNITIFLVNYINIGLIIKYKIPEQWKHKQRSAK